MKPQFDFWKKISMEQKRNKIFLFYVFKDGKKMNVYPPEHLSRIFYPRQLINYCPPSKIDPKTPFLKYVMFAKKPYDDWEKSSMNCGYQLKLMYLVFRSLEKLTYV